MRPHWKKRERRPAAGAHESLIEGAVQHHGRFAFLLSETPGGKDAFLRGRGLELAMDGDRVLARVRRENDGRFSGEIVRVVRHSGAPVVGVLRQVRDKWAVFPEKGDAPPAEALSFASGLKPSDGMVCVLEVTRWPSPSCGAAGRVTEILGEPGGSGVRLAAVLRSLGIKAEFPPEALAQAGAFPKDIPPSAWSGREELFSLPVFTIDGADAKDFDDAVSLEPLPGGAVRLGVHIADVGHYVASGTALDREAYSRGTSVYLPGRGIPMLPPALSDNLCSLLPDVPRLTLSAFIDVDHSGRVTKRRLCRSVIRSCRRFTYEEAQFLLDGKAVPDVPPAAAEAVARMGSLAETLYKRRIKRGALDFNLPEYSVEVDRDGRPVRVTLRPRLKSHRLIEEFMLLANEAVATELLAAKIPFLHRRHDEPDELKLEALAEALGEMGLPAGNLLGAHPQKALQKILEIAEKHPLSVLVNSLLVRSMRQAVYSPVSSGHFGIAARAYTHFTSPIRRYPDLVTHRAVAALLDGGRKRPEKSHPLAAAGAHCSERERAAAEAEHKAVDLLRAQLFSGMVGRDFDGMATSSIDSGSFVALGDTGAEGFLRGVFLKPGTKLKVKICAVDSAEGKIDLSPVSSAPPENVWRFKQWKRGRR